MGDLLIKALKDTRDIYNDYFVYQQDIRILKNKKFMIPQLSKQIIPAEIVSINDDLDRLYNLRRQYYFEYKILEDKILLSENPKVYKVQYDEVLKNINNIQDEIDALHDYFDRINPEDLSKENAIKILKNVLDKITSIPDYVKKYNDLFKLEQENAIPKMEITYVVKKNPIVQTMSTKVEMRKEVLLKRKGALPAEDVKIIKKNIKELIKEKFKFKTKDECTTQKRSQPYYMTKDSIVDTIKNNFDLQLIMPNNYKSLSKENLCKHLFD